MSAGDWVSLYEAVVDGCIEDILNSADSTLAATGPRQFGFVAGDGLEQLRQYLPLRDDAQAWAILIQDWANQVGRNAAEVFAWREATRLERLLDRMGGVEAVQTALVMRQFGAAEKAVRAARKLMDMPAAEVRPPLPPFSVFDVIDQAFGQQAPGTTPEEVLAAAGRSDQEEAGVLPKAWDNAAQYEGMWPPPMRPSLDTPVSQPYGIAPAVTP